MTETMYVPVVGNIKAFRDWSDLHCIPGQCAVEMQACAKSIGHIFIPDSVQNSMRADVGIVIAVGVGVGVNVGDIVGVRPLDGVWVQNFMDCPNEIRFYGKAQNDGMELLGVPWDESIMLIYEGETARAAGRNIIVRREDVHAQERGFVLPDAARYRSCFATVESIGPDAFVELKHGMKVSVGDKIHYNPDGIVQIITGSDNFAVIQDIAINAVIRERNV